MEKEIVPAIGLSINETIGHRNVTLQTHVAGDIDAAGLNAALDKLLKAADRQKLYYETKEERYKLVLNLENHEVQLGQLKRDLVRVDAENVKRWEESNRRGDYVMSAKDRQTRGNVTQNIEAFEFNIERLKKAIAECDEILAKHSVE